MGKAHEGDKSLQRLEKKHQHLKAQVAAYESRRSLSSQEQIALQKLKKEKLATKDAIQRITVV